MSKLKDNLYYFEFSLKNPEPIWDSKFYPFLEKIVPNSEFKNIQMMEDFLKTLGTSVSIKEAQRLFELISLKGCEKSYFAFFLRTCDLSIAELKETEFYNETERLEALKLATEEYKKNRSFCPTDKRSLQAYNDAQTVKRRGNDGEKKVIELTELPLAIDLEDIEGKVNKINKKSGNFKMADVLEKFNIEFALRKEGKVPDVIFSLNGELFLVEAKHVRRQGGSQSGSIGELIALVNLNEKSKNIHYIAFLDGSYSKYLSVAEAKEKGKKLQRQLFQIRESLEDNKDNYFVNTAGFRELIKDLKNNA